MPFGIRIIHTDMNGAVRSTYNVGDYIKFTVGLVSTIQQVKAVIQNCYTTSDGISNRYDLISPGYVSGSDAQIKIKDCHWSAPMTL